MIRSVFGKVILGFCSFIPGSVVADAQNNQKNVDEGFLYDNNRAALNPNVEIEGTPTKIEIYLPSQDGQTASVPSDWNIDVYYKPVMIFDISNLEEQYISKCSPKSLASIHYFYFRFEFPDLSPSVASFISENYDPGISINGLASTTLTPPYRAFDIGYEIKTEGKQDFLVIRSEGSISDQYTDVARVIAPSIISKEHLLSCGRIRNVIDSANAGRDIFWAKLYGYTNKLNEVQEVVGSFSSTISAFIRKEIEESDQNSKVVSVLNNEVESSSITSSGIQLSGGLKLPIPGIGLPVDVSGTVQTPDRTENSNSERSGVVTSVTGGRLVSGSFLSEIKERAVSNSSIVFRNYPEIDRQSIIDAIWDDLTEQLFVDVETSTLELVADGSLVTVRGAALDGNELQFQLDSGDLISDLSQPSQAQILRIKDVERSALQNLTISSVNLDFTNKPASIELEYSVALSKALLEQKSADTNVGVGEYDYASLRREKIDSILNEARLDRDSLEQDISQRLANLESALSEALRATEQRLEGQVASADQRIAEIAIDAASGFATVVEQDITNASSELESFVSILSGQLEDKGDLSVEKILASYVEAEEFSKAVDLRLALSKKLAGDLNGSFALPVGTIIWWSPPGRDALAPDGWAIANGESVELLTGETIKLPNLMTVGIIGGASGNVGSYVGTDKISIEHKTEPFRLNTAHMPSHSHDLWNTKSGIQNKGTIGVFDPLKYFGGDTRDIRKPGKGGDELHPTTKTGNGAAHSHGLEFTFDNRSKALVLVPLFKL